MRTESLTRLAWRLCHTRIDDHAIVATRGRVFAAFGALALMVAAIGLYSVVAYDVAQHRHEVALSGLAARSTVFGTVVLVLIGVAVAASGVPAIHASRVDPATSLRWD